jgi:UDP-glucose 4-epimerase
MKKIILVTGGAGFIGTNLIKRLIHKENYEIISLDNYSTGSKKNHIKNKNIKYINGDTKNISKILKAYKKKIYCIFHFGEFARIHQSFYLTDDCFKSNVTGTFEVFKFSRLNKIRVIYSATSASLGNHGEDANLSPYAFTKAKNIELLNNLKKWFNYKSDIIYFYNVYGPNQIKNGFMSTVIGIFERQYLKKVPLTVVRPGTQKRKFTHIDDTIDACIYVFKKKMYMQFCVSFKKSYTIYEVAKFFKSKIKFIASRLGEREKSSIIKEIRGHKIINIEAKYDIKDYISHFINNK